MKVKELIAQLVALDRPELDVILATDEEGNGYGDLTEVEYGHIARDLKEVEAIHPDDLGEYDAYDVERAVILWP